MIRFMSSPKIKPFRSFINFKMILFFITKHQTQKKPEKVPAPGLIFKVRLIHLRGGFPRLQQQPDPIQILPAIPVCYPVRQWAVKLIQLPERSFFQRGS